MGKRKEKEETTWEDICHMINTNAKEILGETSGGNYVERESWWRNDDVQKAVKEKRDSFKKWQSSRTTEDLADYRENKTNAKKAVTTAKDAGYEELYTKLDSREGQDMIYKLAKTRYRRTLDQEDIVYITDERKHIITDPKRIIGRWLGHFKHLLNIENERFRFRFRFIYLVILQTQETSAKTKSGRCHRGHLEKNKVKNKVYSIHVCTNNSNY